MPDTTPRPDPFAEIIAQFGKENLEEVLAVYRQFADRVDYRRLISWTLRDPVEELLMPVFVAAVVAITRELRLGELVAEMAAAVAVPDSGSAALAESLADTARNLEAHIERRAREIADPQIAVAEADCHQKAATLRREHKQQLQRLEDLVTELRRQLRAQVRQCERQHAEIKEFKPYRDAARRVEAVRVWRNENGRQFVFLDDLHAALHPKTTTEKGNRRA